MILLPKSLTLFQYHKLIHLFYKKSIRISLLFSVLLILSGTTIAQKKYTKTDVREMFPSNVKDLWINTLSGHIDDIHIIDMIIGTDGQTCKGLYSIRNSGTTFFFEGDDINHHLKLVELTSESRTSGFIYGKYDGENFEAIWMNTNKDRTLPMNLSFVNSFEQHLPDRCKQSQWQRIFSGKVDDKTLKVQIIRHDLTFSIACYEDGKKMEEIKLGNDKRVEVFDLTFKNSILTGKSLVVDTSNLNNISIIHLDEGGYEVSSLLKIESSLDFACYEYADYYSKLIAVKLESGHKKFDVWIEQKYKTWIDESIVKLKKSTINFGTKDRWIQSAEGWVEVDLYTSDIISGTLYLQTSVHNETEKIAFIYDLKNGKEIKVQDIFDGKFDSKQYFNAIIPARKKEINWSNECKKWVENENFQYVTLKENGFCFRTNFNTIYGEKEILVPYFMVEQNFKNRNLLKDILIK